MTVAPGRSSLLFQPDSDGCAALGLALPRAELEHSRRHHRGNHRTLGRHRGYFIGMAGVTVPPFALQSFSDSSTQPLPLQEFLPAHEFVALLQAPFPLQEFAPWQWTFASSPADAVVGAIDMNIPAAIAAIIEPFTTLFVVIVVSSCLIRGCLLRPALPAFLPMFMCGTPPATRPRTRPGA
jgi:hypothetical protein